MPARVPVPGDLIVTFCDGEDDQEEIATSGKHALEIAFRMLVVQRDELCDGDLLAVRRVRVKPRPIKPAGQSDG
jgi:hypothetical protein